MIFDIETISLAVIGAVSAVLNLILGLRDRGFKHSKEVLDNNKELLETVMAQLDAINKVNNGLEEEIKDLEREKHNFKTQYHDLLLKSKQLESELETYKRMHKHDHVSKLD